MPITAALLILDDFVENNAPRVPRWQPPPPSPSSKRNHHRAPGPPNWSNVTITPTKHSRNEAVDEGKCVSDGTEWLGQPNRP